MIRSYLPTLLVKTFILDKILIGEYRATIVFILAKTNHKGWIVMPNVQVSCSVSNCVFHAKGNFCGAEKIAIDMDKRMDNNYDEEFAADFELHTMTEAKASESSDTCCKTFKSKEKKL